MIPPSFPAPQAPRLGCILCKHFSFGHQNGRGRREIHGFAVMIYHLRWMICTPATRLRTDDIHGFAVMIYHLRWMHTALRYLASFVASARRIANMLAWQYSFGMHLRSLHSACGILRSEHYNVKSTNKWYNCQPANREQQTTTGLSFNTRRPLRYPPYGGLPRIGGDLDLRVVSSCKSSPKVGKMTLGEFYMGILENYFFLSAARFCLAVSLPWLADFSYHSMARA